MDDDEATRVSREIAKLQAVIAALRRYAKHLGHCPAYPMRTTRPGPCTCGLKELL